ncbi:MAG: biotin-dependent carboxyltransferase family protein [Proteobacteria bacterium]|nr:biotin-dependent carboxyltransferase family protein [Pseudomonadota bacterium]
MSILVIRPGLQTSIQASPRMGLRHLGVPASGPADPLSMALANHLVGNPLLAPALETTLTGVELQFESDAWFAITGAPSNAELRGAAVEFFRTCHANAGDNLQIGPADTGVRVYVAVAGGFVADELLGSMSTYLPAAFGGHEGRALEKDDRLSVMVANDLQTERVTPNEFRPTIMGNWALRTCDSADAKILDDDSRDLLFDTHFTIGKRADRMGLQLDGATLSVSSGGRWPSAPVFPGCIQCPEGGSPFILSVDAQTTGGYPSVAQIARADRHMLGQLRPGDHLQLLKRTAAQAIEDLHEKIDYWRAWLPGIESVI